MANAEEIVLVPYSLNAAIKNKKTGGALKLGNLQSPPRYLSWLISRLPGLEFNNGLKQIEEDGTCDAILERFRLQ